VEQEVVRVKQVKMEMQEDSTEVEAQVVMQVNI
jgi:hypothetical protein